ncbi:site-specific integrase [Clostridium sp. JS66]|uniref:tyrosine-type recombinase/integrase n=1 Tax=Clostridium sp. JS66 TaxID=3064705 RepID=UPI00298E31E4|nr:site-specific integrase [Clostridium sp. JS66]WPC42389.1 site-specific integrase [Clostridium sp. JS66]
MIIIKEQKKQNATYYIKEIYNTKNILIYTEVIYLKSSIIENKKHLSYFILYDENMKPIREAFRFLNYGLNGKAINSKEKSLYALKLLYMFEKIINKSIECFNRTDISNLINFLRGFSPEGQVISFQVKTERNSETISGYFSVYRKYIKFLNLTESFFLKKSEKELKVLILENDKDMSVTPYELGSKPPCKNQEIPKYISVEEFKKILEIIRKYYSKREECIIRLMYQCGLRIGEVLGLTADDVVITKIGDDYVAVGYLRNRVTDKKDQMAKTCMKVTNKKQYRLKEYKENGFQKIIIPMDLYDLINDYIDETHVYAREHKRNNYYKYTIADRVSESEEYEDDNYYIFLNSLGKPLRSHLWNYTLRKIFEKSHISVDTNVRKNNLNHKFRHGYAMYNVNYLKVKILELKEKMRHKSLLSVSCYYQPTFSDKIKLKDEFTKDLYSVIPELNIC